MKKTSLDTLLEPIISERVVDLTNDIRSTILNELRSKSVEEALTMLLGAGEAKTMIKRSGGSSKPSTTGGRVRRSADDLEALATKIEDELKKHADGLRSEELRGVLAIEKKDIGRPIALLLSQKRIKKTGEKRATVYFATGKGSAKASKAKAPKKNAKKVSAKPKKVTKAKTSAKDIAKATKAARKKGAAQAKRSAKAKKASPPVVNGAAAHAEPAPDVVDTSHAEPSTN